MTTLETLQAAQAAAAVAYEVANITGPESKRQAAMAEYDRASSALIEYRRSI